VFDNGFRQRAALLRFFSDKNQPVKTSGTNPTSSRVIITKYIKLIFFGFGGISSCMTAKNFDGLILE
jgi:hypothetical protein